MHTPSLKPASFTPRRFLAFVAMTAGLVGVVQGQVASAVSSSAMDQSIPDQLLEEAHDLFDLGLYGAADRKCRQVLAFDHQNKQALHGRELIRQARAELATRRRDVDQPGMTVFYPQIDWESPGAPGDSLLKEARIAQIVALKTKLQGIIIPSIEFHSLPLREAVAFLAEASRPHGPDGQDGNTVIELQLQEAAPVRSTPGPDQSQGETAMNPGPAAPPACADTPVTLSLSRIPAMTALYYVACVAGVKVKIEPDKVLLVPASTVMDDPMSTVSVRVPKEFIGTPKDAVNGDDADVDEIDAKEFLENSGVTFPPGANAVYLKRTSRLIVRNTQDNLDLVLSSTAPDCRFPVASPAATPPVTDP